MQKHNISELNRLYTEADEADKEIYAEMRSNVLLISGDHYNRKTSRVYSRIRDTKDVTDTQRLRLTKNHTHKVVRNYTTNILTYSPGVSVMPKNPSELQDQKAAELNQSVWQDAVDKHKVKSKIRDWCGDFVGIGEVAVKLFFDPNKGDFKGYEAKLQMDEEGNVLVDEMGQPMPELDDQGQLISDESKPTFAGDFVFERIFGFNLLRPIGIKSMVDAPWLGLRKMVPTKELKSLYADQPEAAQKIQDSPKEDFIVFDQNKGEYSRTKDQVLVREIYFRPCYDYPNGYFYIFTSDVILSEGELPYGIFPIVYTAFDEMPTAPRGRSIVKQIRPYQAELNRAASQLATHQVTLGDDKVIYQQGTKLSPGSLLPGVRGITYQGSQPTVLPGRDGSQFMPYIDSTIKELYQIVDMDEENQEINSQMDPYTMLYTSLKHRKKFATYGEKFEQFLIEVCDLYLELAKKYLPEDALIYAVGKSEQINIAEFRSTTKLCYQIRLEPRNDNMETALGKQLTFQHILQYVGNQLDKKDIGKMIRLMPFGNSEEGFEDLTLDYDNARNEILALDRGEMSPIMPKYEDPTYPIKMLTNRMNKPDFQFLPPQVQQAYQMRLNQYEQKAEELAQKEIAAKDQFIPVSGPLVACDLYMNDKEDPSKAAKRARIPYTALEWLVKRLDSQGQTLDKLENMNQVAVADMVDHLTKQTQGQRPGMPMPQMNQQMPMTPNASPLGGGMASRPARPLGAY